MAEIFDTANTRIIVVDDSDSNVMILKSLLARRGFQVEAAFSGESALEMIHENPPDLVLLDIQMPNMDGYEVCRRLKAEAQTCDIPIIFISALDNTENIVHAFEAGGSDYVTKPFRFMEVVARVENHLMLVHQRRQLEARREQDHQRFEAINKMKTHFIGTATHDLKNPLLVILGYVALMEKQASISENKIAISSLQGIRSSVDKMTTLVTDMLDLVQMESGVELHKKPVSLATFLRSCLQGFDVLADQSQIQLLFSQPLENLTVDIDEKRLKRVFDNLISNAIKYTPGGGTIEVKAFAQNGHSVIQVIDTGYGIPSDAVPHLFETFYRVKSEQHMQVDGTGLGLAIVKAIVEQHRGTIEVESEMGKGSSFTIRLPL